MKTSSISYIVKQDIVEERGIIPYIMVIENLYYVNMVIGLNNNLISKNFIARCIRALLSHDNEREGKYKYQ